MVEVNVRAHIFRDDHQEADGIGVQIEMYDVREQFWRVLDSVGVSGILDTVFDMGRFNMFEQVPPLRLVHAENPDRVLSAGPMWIPDGSQRRAIADFGEIVVLPNVEYLRFSMDGRDEELVGGLPRAKEVPVAQAIRSAFENPGGNVIGDDSAKLKAELQTLHAINLDNTNKLAERDRTVATQSLELTLKNDELAKALERANEAEAQLAQNQVDNQGTQADIQDVFSNIGTRIGSASLALKASDNPYRIGAVRVDLKGSLKDDGTITLGGDRVDGSGLSVELSPETQQGADAVTVPDVTGLTQSAARRVLRSVGLRLKQATQTVQPGTDPHGQSLRQIPAAGASARHGTEVLVVFASVQDT